MNEQLYYLLALTNISLQKDLTQKNGLPDGLFTPEEVEKYEMKLEELRAWRSYGKALKEGKYPADGFSEIFIHNWKKAIDDARIDQKKIANKNYDRSDREIERLKKARAKAVEDYSEAVERLNKVFTKINASNQRAESFTEGIESILEFKKFADNAMLLSNLLKAQTAGNSGAVLGELSAIKLNEALPSTYTIESLIETFAGSIEQNAKRISESWKVKAMMEILVMENGSPLIEDVISPVRDLISRIRKIDQEINALEEKKSDASDYSILFEGVYDNFSNSFPSADDEVKNVDYSNQQEQIEQLHPPDKDEIDGDGERVNKETGESFYKTRFSAFFEDETEGLSSPTDDKNSNPETNNEETTDPETEPSALQENHVTDTDLNNTNTQLSSNTDDVEITNPENPEYEESKDNSTWDDDTENDLEDSVDETETESDNDQTDRDDDEPEELEFDYENTEEEHENDVENDADIGPIAK